MAVYNHQNKSKLSPSEEGAISGGRWFASLSSVLRRDIFQAAIIRRYVDGELIAVRGGQPDAWWGCAKGAVRVSSVSISGKLITLDYVEPGIWFGDVSLLDGGLRTHDVYAYGDTTLLWVPATQFHELVRHHAELNRALLQLQAKRLRLLYGVIEDLNTLPLRARLARQIGHLVRSYGVPSLSADAEIRISLQLAQEELAQLLGVSRQSVNQELKAMEREGVLRVELTGLVICDRVALLRIGQGEEGRYSQ